MADSLKLRIALTVAIAALGVAGSTMVSRGNEAEIPTSAGATVLLSDLPWERATTSWVALADDNLPKLDSSFLNEVITIGTETYEKGIGTFPLSEIVYSLGGKYQLFEAEIGIDGAVPEGKGSVVFKLFLDDVPAFESGVVQSGMAPLPVTVPVAGVERMKLVVENAGDGSSLDYANWANARLLPAAKSSPQASGQLPGTLTSTRLEMQREREKDWATVRGRFDQELTVLAKVFEGTYPLDSQATARFDADQNLIVLANNQLAVTLGYGGDRHGLLDVVDLQGHGLVAYDTTPSLTTKNLSMLALSQQSVPADAGGYYFRRVEDPALGPGVEATVDFLIPGSGAVISPRITLFDGSNYLTYRLELREVESDVTVQRFTYFDLLVGGSFVLGEDSAYITDYSLPRWSEVRDDSILRQELVGLGKPVLLYSKAQSRALVMAIVDEVPDPAQFSLRLESGHISGRLGFEQPVLEDVRDTRIQTSPRLFLQVTRYTSTEETTRQYRKVMASLYPPPPMPDWAKYQWGTWYAFYMDYDEDILREQIDYIADNLADLGPWSILLDAGWYVAEGRPDSTWDREDGDKFPSGLRALVDYAHSRGIKVVLYFSAPYLDDRVYEGNWLGLRGFIEEHPDWILRLRSDNSGASYVYDFTNPELVQYMRKLVSDFFLLYDVDGIKIDGLGQAEGEQLSAEERDTFGDVNSIRMFTMDIYRLIYEEAIGAKKDAYIESGWAIPNFAAPFAHSFRYADEFPQFEHRYPTPGLLEHVDYAAMQKTVLGQRPNMGMVWGGPESNRMIRLWFEAALAMGTQMTISTDLTHMSSRDLSDLRSVLLHYNAFEGETSFVGLPFPNSFATTTSNGITYLGAMNRARESKAMAFNLHDYGLDEQTEYLLYDVSSNRYRRVRGSFSASLEGSSFRLFLLRDTPGVMWSNSSYQAESNANSLTLEVTGPSSIIGFAQIHTPRPSAVRLDGEELDASPRLNVGNSYWYNEETGLLRLRYRHDRTHTIEVNYGS